MDYSIAFPLFSIAWIPLLLLLLEPLLSYKWHTFALIAVSTLHTVVVNIIYINCLSFNTQYYFVHPFLCLNLVLLTTLSTSEGCEPCCMLLCTFACSYCINIYLCWQVALKTENKFKNFLLFFFCSIFPAYYMKKLYLVMVGCFHWINEENVTKFSVVWKRETRKLSNRQ